MHKDILKPSQSRYSSELDEVDEEDELDDVIDLCFCGKEIPLDDSLQIIFKRIFAILDEAQEDGAHILPRSLIILCVDEAKHACAEGLIPLSLSRCNFNPLFSCSKDTTALKDVRRPHSPSPEIPATQCKSALVFSPKMTYLVAPE